MRIVLALSLVSSVQANASIEDADRAIKAARYADGIAELRRLTAAGNVRAEAKLGWLTLMGIGLPRDPAKAK
ncbi:tetratricopeptide repeat protein, partial [Ralstonia pseudosolanacearum]